MVLIFGKLIQKRTMKNRHKVKFAPDQEYKKSPSLLEQHVLGYSPEQLTFKPLRPDTTPSHIVTTNKELSEQGLHLISPTSSIIGNGMQNRTKQIDFNRRPSNSTKRPSIQTLASKKMGQRSEEQQLQIERQVTQMKNVATMKNNSKNSKIIFEKNNSLEMIVRSQKINNIRDNFIRKVTRTSTSHPPVNYTQFSDYDKDSLLNLPGIELPPIVDSLFNFLSVIQISTLLVVYSISITFEDLIRKSDALSMLQIGSLVFYFLQIVLNFISVKSQAGKKVEVLKQIFYFYGTNHFWIDFVSLVILFLDIASNLLVINYLRLFIIFKLPQCLKKIQKIEVYLIRNVYNEQYWELAKVFLVNFCYAHLIALVLSAMANLSPSDSWMAAKGISQSPWATQYVWSYYWAVNIMLTVGFGDIVATNALEASFLIFIETFSCIMMAYNVNCVGAIISNIRSQDQLRNQKFKIFKKLTDQNQVPEDLAFKITNYIEESSNLRKKFNQEEEKQFMEELPVALKTSYLREANRTILKQLVFFRTLLEHTLCNFAEHIESKIAHPQEIVRAIDDDFNLVILKFGKIGYACKKQGFAFNEEITDLIKVEEGGAPYLTSLDFISKQRPLYEIKSLQFSVILMLPYNKFIEIFKTSNMDYEHYCLLRDKIRNIPDELEVHPCQFCVKFNHFKFSCPRLHYAPLEQHIINKELHREMIGRNERQRFMRSKAYGLTPMEYFKKVKKYRQIGGLKVPKERVNYGNKSLLETFKNAFCKSLKEQMTNDDPTEDTFYSKTKQIIQMQFLQREKTDNFVDDIWGLSLDVMENFNNYFSNDNPRALADKFSSENRKSQKSKRINWYDSQVTNNSEVSHELNQSARSLFLSHQFIKPSNVSLQQV